MINGLLYVFVNYWPIDITKYLHCKQGPLSFFCSFAPLGSPGSGEKLQKRGICGGCAVGCQE